MFLARLLNINKGVCKLNNILLNSLLSYFKVEISNEISLLDNELIINFKDGNKAKITIVNI